MHLFLRERRLAPAEIADRFGAVREGLPCPQPRHAVARRWIMRRPVHRPRLLFHDPPAPARGRPVEVVMKGLEIRIAGACEAALPLLSLIGAVLEEAERIG